jgi:hypothetical protein
MGEVRRRGVLRHLSPANVLSTLALVAVIGGGTALAGGNTGKVGNWNVEGFNYQAGANSSEKNILKAEGLKLVASCGSAVNLDTWEARTAEDNASYYSYGWSSDDSQPDFDTSGPLALSRGGERDAVYTSASGHIVVVQYFSFDAGNDPGSSKCRVAGTAFYR